MSTFVFAALQAPESRYWPCRLGRQPFNTVPAPSTAQLGILVLPPFELVDFPFFQCLSAALALKSSYLFHLSVDS